MLVSRPALLVPLVRALTGAARPIARPASTRIATYATSAIRIGNLTPAVSKKNGKRLGRGDGSGRGGTATRGHKGQKARAGNGKPKPGFEGGQTPLTRLIPKRGFTNPHKQHYAPLNVNPLQNWIEQVRLANTKPIKAR